MIKFDLVELFFLFIHDTLPIVNLWFEVDCNFDPVLLPIIKRYFNISVTFAKVYSRTCDKLQPVTFDNMLLTKLPKDNLRSKIDIFFP